MTIAERLARLDWPALQAGLWERGWASTPAVLTREECDGLVRLYADDTLFRSRVDMERHRFGMGDYKYFARPLPALVEQLRVHAYPRLAGIASAWMEALGTSERFPSTLGAFLARCAKAGQDKPTPLLLHYEAGGYNCLHQDVYGRVGFPLQVVAFLSRPVRDYEGGEFLLVEQRPRPIGGGGDRGRARRPARLHQPLPARARRPRVLPGERTARRQPGALGDPLHAGRHLPRR
jgi:hypothetical protein